MISFVIPAYNEAKRLPQSISKLADFADSQKYKIEIIVVVERSVDKTYELAKKAVDGDTRFRIVNNKEHYGKGFAIKTGMQMAKGEIAFFMDADLSTDLSAVKNFYDLLKTDKSVDIVIGSRAHPDSQLKIKQNWLRQSLGKTNNQIIKLLKLSDFSDTQCGFKAFRSSVAKELFSKLKTDGFAFDVEILMRANKAGFKVVEQPVIWKNSPGSKVNLFFGPISMLLELVKLKLNLVYLK